MALVQEFERRQIERMTLHDPIPAKYAVFEYDGRKLLQIDTYGRSTRQHPGKVSQSLQFDRASAKALFEILRREFAL